MCGAVGLPIILSAAVGLQIIAAVGLPAVGLPIISSAAVGLLLLSIQTNNAAVGLPAVGLPVILSAAVGLPVCCRTPDY